MATRGRCRWGYPRTLRIVCQACRCPPPAARSRSHPQSPGARALRRRRRRPAGRRHPVTSRGRSVRTGGSFAGTPERCAGSRTHVGARVRGRDRARGGATADAVDDEVAACLAGPEFRPRRRFSASLSRCWPPPTIRSTRWPPRAPGRGRIRRAGEPDAAGQGQRQRLWKLSRTARCAAGAVRALPRARRDRDRHWRRRLLGHAASGSRSRGDPPPRAGGRRYRAGGAGKPSQRALPARVDGRRRRAGDAGARQLRARHTPTFGRFGPDSGHDIPRPTTFTEPLRELLNAVGTSAKFRIVLFTTDEAAFSRELTPLAGFCPGVYIGAPWWFPDAPAPCAVFAAPFPRRGHRGRRRLDARYLAELVRGIPWCAPARRPQGSPGHADPHAGGAGRSGCRADLR